MQRIAPITSNDPLALQPAWLHAAWWLLTVCALALIGGASVGCGINKSRLATEQLVIADAVDEAVAKVDFSPLSGQKVFLDTSYVEDLKIAPNSNVPYVISSLRQQIVAYNCRLQEKKEDADFIVEVRLGVLAADGDEVTYGIPGNNAAVKTAASAMPTVGSLLPAIPDLSPARRTYSIGAAKIGVFAYDRITREPVWQAGVATGNSQARDLWVMGIGPFQKGRIYKRNTGEKIERAISSVSEEASAAQQAYSDPVLFQRAMQKKSAQQQTASQPGAAAPVRQAAAQQPAPVVSPDAPPPGAQGAADRPVAGK